MGGNNRSKSQTLKVMNFKTNSIVNVFYTESSYFGTQPAVKPLAVRAFGR
jgi:hypothetical protein